ncbi:MAG: carbon storage regulator CsrA [Candidatus Methylomirabilales bacterium]
MLVLTRKAGERIEIGEDIVLEIVEVRQGQVRLGIQAPARVPIFREEVARQIREENRRAADQAAIPLDALVAKLRQAQDA